MHWYGWLLIGVLLAFVIFLVVVLLRKKPVGLTDEDWKKLSEAERNKLQADLDAEKIRNEKLQKIAAEQQAALANIKVQFEKIKEQIDETRRHDFETYLNNDVAGAELDKLLGLIADNGK